MKSFMLAALILAALVSVAFGGGANQNADVYYSNDGSGNTIRDPENGAYLQYQIRQTPSNFADLDSPNARVISNTVGAEPNEFIHKNLQGVNLFEAFFAQFVNHDKEFSRTAENNTFYGIEVFPGDSLYSTAVGANNNLEIGISAQVVDQFKHNSPLEPQIVNHATSWFDLSALYGNNDAQANALRQFSGGRLKTSSYTVFAGPFPTVIANHLPSKAVTGLENITPLTVSPSNILTAGDARVNENVGLALITTLFLREHNRIAGVLSAANPSASDEVIFQHARRLNIAQYQHILIDEYLPVIASQPHIERLGHYRGYKRNKDAETSLEYSLGAFRYGHSTVSSYFMLNASYCPYLLTVPAGVFGPVGFTTPVLPFAGQVGGAFSIPMALVFAGGENNLLRGLLTTKGNKVDTKFTDTVRNIQFVGANGLGVDLLAFDIIRGRMNGLGSYQRLRRKFFEMDGVDGDANVYDVCDGRPRREDEVDPLECFLQVTSDTTLASQLRTIYGKVNKIDGFVGLLAEDHLPGSFLPRTLANIVIDEYKRSRDADRFWYENDGILTDDEFAAVQSRSLAQIVRDAFPDLEVQDDIFKVPAVPKFCSP